MTDAEKFADLDAAFRRYRERTDAQLQAAQEARGSKLVPCRNDHAPKGEDGEHEPASYCAGCLYDLTAQLQAAQEELAKVRSMWQVQTADWADRRIADAREIERLRGENVELKAERVILHNTIDERERNLAAWQDRYFTLERRAALTPEGTQETALD